MILQDFYDGKAFDAYEFFGAHRENGKIVPSFSVPEGWDVVGDKFFKAEIGEK